MALESLHDLYVGELKDLYSAETQLLKALPRLAKAASAPELQEAFHDHLEVTRGQVARLLAIFEAMGVSPKGKRCKAVEGLVEEGEQVIGEGGPPSVVDAALIASAQRVEHYEIAGYGCARTFASLLDHGEAARLLQLTLDEEAAAGKKLASLAETIITPEADEEAGREKAPKKKAGARARQSAQPGGAPAPVPSPRPPDV